MLDKEFKYYLDHKDELIHKYYNKFIVIKNNSVIGVYDSNSEALSKTAESHELGTFLIQLALPGKESQTFHSRVLFHTGLK